jgi:hypothetical protein
MLTVISFHTLQYLKQTEKDSDKYTNVCLRSFVIAIFLPIVPDVTFCLFSVCKEMKIMSFLRSCLPIRHWHNKLPFLPKRYPARSCTCTWWPGLKTTSSSSWSAPNATSWTRNLGTSTSPRKKMPNNTISSFIDKLVMFKKYLKIKPTKCLSSFS